jgi:hypothetical protein
MGSAKPFIVLIGGAPQKNLTAFGSTRSGGALQECVAPGLRLWVGGLARFVAAMSRAFIQIDNAAKGFAGCSTLP